jgi:hypothetical protein
MPTSYTHQLNTLLTRFDFHFTKSQIKQVLAVTSRSKKELIEDVIAVIDDNQGVRDKINELGLLALQLDTRQIEVFNIDIISVKDSLDLLFNKIKLTTNTLITHAFPFPIEDKDQLRKLKTGTVYPVLSDSVTLGSDVYNRMVVCTAVDKVIEEPVPADYLSPSGKDRQDDNTSYIMKRKVRTQLFHLIYWCSNKSKLILSVDRNVLSVSVSQEQLFVLRRFLMARGVDCGSATNVFGAIDPVYNANDGNVTKLGHVTTSGNPVRIPLKGRQKCLKEDSYHQAGEGGGYVHAKFAVAKIWVFKIDDTAREVDVEVGLMGQPKMLDTAQPLTDFSINKPKRLVDLSFAIDKVLSHVPNS